MCEGGKNEEEERDALGLLSNPNPRRRNWPIPPSTGGRIKVMLSSGGDGRAKIWRSRTTASDGTEEKKTEPTHSRLSGKCALLAYNLFPWCSLGSV